MSDQANGNNGNNGNNGKQRSGGAPAQYKLRIPIENIYEAIHALLNNGNPPISSRGSFSDARKAQSAERVTLATLSRFKACRLFMLAEKRSEAYALVNMSDLIWGHIKDLYAKRLARTNGERKAMAAMEVRRNGRRKRDGKAIQEVAEGRG